MILNKFTACVAVLITIILACMKFAEVGTMPTVSWWVVFAPLPLLAGLALAVFVVVVVVGAPIILVNAYRKDKK